MYTGSKSDYLSSILFGRPPSKRIVDAANLFWDCKIPLLNATLYLDRLEETLNDNLQREN